MKSWLAVMPFLIAGPVLAEWQFSQPVEVGSPDVSRKVFHHLESANRHGLSESAGRVALVWEDDRAGLPRCWLAVREKNAQVFSKPQVLGAGECYEPVVQGMGAGRFVAAWEEDGGVWVKPSGDDKAIRLNRSEAAHVTLARMNDHTFFAAWAERDGVYKSIRIARIVLGKGGLTIQANVPLEIQSPTDGQSYPALAVNEDGSVAVVWEDRRFKHTAMLASYSADGGVFSPPYRLINVGRVRSTNLGAGLGSMRPTLSSCGSKCLVALWLDKRDFLSGYDVYAAFSQDGGKTFGANIKVQDSFGDNIAQWHAAVASNRTGRVVVAWDDDRDGTPDIWASNWNGNAFSDNLAVPAASGAGAQSEPLVYLDDAGMLHIAWLERNEDGGTSFRYAEAVWKN